MEQESFLQHGDILSGCSLEETFGTLAMASRAWSLHRDRLLSEWRAGHRPFGFWLFDIEPKAWRHLDDPPEPLPAWATHENYRPIPADALSNWLPRNETKVLLALALMDEAEQAASARLLAPTVEQPKPPLDPAIWSAVQLPDENHHSGNGHN